MEYVEDDILEAGAEDGVEKSSVLDAGAEDGVENDAKEDDVDSKSFETEGDGDSLFDGKYIIFVVLVYKYNSYQNIYQLSKSNQISPT